MRQCVGLAGSRAGDDQEWRSRQCAFATVAHGLTLLWIEIVEICRRSLCQHESPLK
jgi:hypothetical protein